MTITNKSATLDVALGNIDKGFREKIIDTYLELKHRAFKAVYTKEFDSAGLSAGKFCETLFRFIEQELKGTYTPFTGHITNMAIELSKLEQLPKTAGNESLRIIIPRSILVIYTLRNKRGIGHVGGDIEANEIDLSTIIKLSDWIVAELIRVYHKLSIEDAQGVIDSINSKEIPTVWEINGKKRVLQKGLDYKDKVLLILYSDINNSCAVEDLIEWTEYSNSSLFKSKLLKGMHKENLIEYDTELEFAHLSPLGIAEVEQRILKTAL
jgi:hypothetical protein